jgi:alpha-1,3-rhamnosyltransferase
MVGNSANSEMDDAGTITILESRNPIFGKEMATAEEMLDLEFSNIHSFFLQGTAFRADFLTAVGAFDENCVGDDLILRTKIWLHMITHPGLRFAFLRRSGFVYRKHAQNQHHNGSRQLRTVVEWRNRFFPDRDMPALAQRWACNYFNQLLDRRDYYALNEILASDPQLMGIFEKYCKTWKFRRRAIKHIVKRMLRRADGSFTNSKNMKKED